MLILKGGTQKSSILVWTGKSKRVLGSFILTFCSGCLLACATVVIGGDLAGFEARAREGLLSRVARLKTPLSACNNACCARANGLGFTAGVRKEKRLLARGRLHTDDSAHFISKIPSCP